MDVLLLLVMLAVGAGVGYLVATADTRVARRVDPLIRGALNEASAAAEQAGGLIGDKVAGQVHGMGDELGTRLSVARAERQQLHDELERLDAKLEDIKDLVTAAVAGQEAAGQRDRRAADELVAVARQVEELASGQEGIVGYLRSRLADEARAAAGGQPRQVIATSVRAGESQDVLRGMVAEFCGEIGLAAVLPGQRGEDEAYYASGAMAGPPVEDMFAALLAACPRDEAPPSAGLGDLRRLLLVLRAEGPGVIEIGPMILASSAEALLGCVVTAKEALGETRLRETPPGQSLPEEPLPREPGPGAGPGAAAISAWLRGLGAARAVDLTAWAAEHSR